MSTFEENYLALRAKEGRILSDSQVKLLPFFSGNAMQKKEWKIRAQTAKLFCDYLEQSKKKSILEIGCGNGWFAAKLSAVKDVQVIAIDVNQMELDQAIRVFGHSNPIFRKEDIFNSDFNGNSFDLIALNASIQYFPSLSILISRLRSLLNENGEIHLLDTPFYKDGEVVAAKERSRIYYEQNGFPELTKHYFHHSISEVEKAGAIFLYKPSSRLFRKLTGKSPFPWLKLNKQ